MTNKFYMVNFISDYIKKVKILHEGKDGIELKVDLKKQKIKPAIDNLLFRKS